MIDLKKRELLNNTSFKSSVSSSYIQDKTGDFPSFNLRGIYPFAYASWAVIQGQVGSGVELAWAIWPSYPEVNGISKRITIFEYLFQGINTNEGTVHCLEEVYPVFSRCIGLNLRGCGYGLRANSERGDRQGFKYWRGLQREDLSLVWRTQDVRGSLGWTWRTKQGNQLGLYLLLLEFRPEETQPFLQVVSKIEVCSTNT